MKKSDLTTLKILPQECGGEYRFTGDAFMTPGFQLAFGSAAVIVAIAAHDLIVEERVKGPEGADYLQVFCFGDIHFWCLDDIDHITFLLPAEY